MNIISLTPAPSRKFAHLDTQISSISLSMPAISAHLHLSCEGEDEFAAFEKDAELDFFSLTPAL